MKKIAIPFDFTEVSCNAYDYARKVYGPKAVYEIIHVDNGLLDNEAALGSSKVLTKAAVTKESIKSFLVEKLGFHISFNEQKFTLLQGSVKKELVKYLVEKGFDMIVMGTRDNYDFIDKWLGTVSLHIAKQTELPLLLIPKYSKFSDYQKVMVASDFRIKQTGWLDKLKEWNIWKAYVKFFHVQVAENDDFKEESSLIVNKLFEEYECPFGFEVDVIAAKNISESLLANAYNFRADILLLLPEKQNSLNRMLLKSVSKEVIQKSHIPILLMR